MISTIYKQLWAAGFHLPAFTYPDATFPPFPFYNFSVRDVVYPEIVEQDSTTVVSGLGYKGENVIDLAPYPDTPNEDSPGGDYTDAGIAIDKQWDASYGRVHTWYRPTTRFWDSVEIDDSIYAPIVSIIPRLTAGAFEGTEIDMCPFCPDTPELDITYTKFTGLPPTIELKNASQFNRENTENCWIKFTVEWKCGTVVGPHGTSNPDNVLKDGFLRVFYQNISKGQDRVLLAEVDNIDLVHGYHFFGGGGWYIGPNIAAGLWIGFFGLWGQQTGLEVQAFNFVSEPTAKDFWTYGPNNNPSNPGFNPKRILILSPHVSTNFALGKTVTIDDFGDEQINYPVVNISDGEGSTACRIHQNQGSFIVDLGSAMTPDVLSIINHNIDEGNIISIQASNDVTFATTTWTGWGIAARKPNCWIDLRNMSVPSSRYWKVMVLTATPNSVPISIGDIVIGTVFTLEGGVDGGSFERDTQYHVTRAITEEGLVQKSQFGSKQRSLKMNMTLFTDIRGYVESTFEDVGMVNGRVLVIPDSQRNECYFIEWEPIKNITYPQSKRVAITQLNLLEESFGVI